MGKNIENEVAAKIGGKPHDFDMGRKDLEAVGEKSRQTGRMEGRKLSRRIGPGEGRASCESQIVKLYALGPAIPDESCRLQHLLPALAGQAENHMRGAPQPKTAGNRGGFGVIAGGMPPVDAPQRFVVRALQPELEPDLKARSSIGRQKPGFVPVETIGACRYDKAAERIRGNDFQGRDGAIIDEPEFIGGEIRAGICLEIEKKSLGTVALPRKSDSPPDLLFKAGDHGGAVVLVDGKPGLGGAKRTAASSPAALPVGTGEARVDAKTVDLLPVAFDETISVAVESRFHAPPRARRLE